MAVVAATGVMLAACDWGAEPPHPSKSSGGPGSVALPVGTRGCPFAPVWPTYLPWLGQGQAVPFPLAGRSLDTGDSVLTWAPGGTNAAPSGPGQAVTLIRTGRPVDATAGTPVPVWIEGSSIGLLRNDVPPGTATIAWSLPAVCPTVSLQVFEPGRSGLSVRAIALRVARSLRPRPPVVFTHTR